MEGIRHLTVAQEVADRLWQLIKEEGYQPGAKLPTERELIDRLGVARSSIREGIKLLQASDVLRVHQGKGMFLNQVSVTSALGVHQNLSGLVQLQKHDLSDVMAARRLIEAETARLAALRATPVDLERLAICIADMEKTAHDRAAFVEADLNFHTGVAEVAGNRVLVRLMQVLRELYVSHWLVAGHLAGLPGVTRASCDQHRRILAAIAAGDTVAASAAMVDHIGINAERIVNASLHPETVSTL